MTDTRQRIIDAALRLFGEQGFAGTSVAQIEAAAGLKAGSGGLYRHFRSKEALLIESVGSRLGDRGEWEALLRPEASVLAVMDALAPGQSLSAQLTALCRAGMQRLDHDRDINRLLMRDNSIDPEVLEVFRKEEYEFITSVVEKALRELAPISAAEDDWRSVAAVVVGAIVHFWLITDIFGGTHPLAITADTYLATTAAMIAARLHTPSGDAFPPTESEPTP